jgi:hypothetical protein
MRDVLNWAEPMQAASCPHVGRTATVVIRDGEKEVLPIVSFFLFFPLFSQLSSQNGSTWSKQLYYYCRKYIVIGLGYLAREGANNISYATIIIQLHIHLIVLVPKV